MLAILTAVAKLVFALFELVSGDAPGLERLRLGNNLMYELPYGFGNSIRHRFSLIVTGIGALLSMLSVAVGEELVIAEGGKSDYAIVVAVDATMQDHYAASGDSKDKLICYHERPDGPQTQPLARPSATRTRQQKGMRSPVQLVIMEIHHDAPPRTLRPNVRPGETSLRPPRDKHQHASSVQLDSRQEIPLL